ncbi:flagellar biosynthesis protein FlgB [Sphingobium sp.]|uniref:flagellar biosynthesis protein FlgB n=1 Tax=Sphingobium sp. TaxID=1912891 RepID=UPI0035C74DA2
MTFTPPLLAGIGQSMKHLSERQRVIAQNIANGETPGFKAQTVEAPDFSSLVQVYGGSSGKPRVGRPQVHLSGGMAALGARMPRGGSGVVAETDISETKPDGNNITLEDQLLKMGEVQSDFAAMTNLYRKQIGLLKTAIGRN